MKVLHLMGSGEFGGIEVMMKNYARLSNLDNIFLFIYKGGTVYDEMRRNGCQCINIKESRDHFFHNVMAITKACLKINPDVVITHHNGPQLKAVIAILSFFHSNIKTISYAHTNAANMSVNENKLKSAINRVITKIGLMCADRVVAISESVADSLVDIFAVPRSKIDVIYNGVPIDDFSSMKHRKCKEIVFVGRLIEGKGVQVILEALSYVKTDWHFNVIGDGDYRVHLEKLTDDLGLKDKVSFFGSRSDVSRFLSEASVFVSTPVLEEGFGNTIVEAMASGLVCICSRSGAIPEIIQDRVNGYLVDKCDSKQLANVILSVLLNYDSAENAAIREQACIDSKKYSIESYTEKLENVVGGVTEK